MNTLQISQKHRKSQILENSEVFLGYTDQSDFRNLRLPQDFQLVGMYLMPSTKRNRIIQKYTMPSRFTFPSCQAILGVSKTNEKPQPVGYSGGPPV